MKEVAKFGLGRLEIDIAQRGILSSVRLRRIGLAFLALIVLFLWWQMVRRALAGTSSQLDDFLRFSRDLLFQGRNIYEEYEPTYTITKYPPVFAFLFAPLVPLPMAIAASIWFWLNLLLSGGAAVVSALIVSDGGVQGGERRRVLLPYVLASAIIISNLLTGQVNILIMFFLCLALLLYRHGRDLLAGGFLGAVIALKLTPAVFLLYFAWKRERRVLTGAAASLAIGWGLLPLLTFGPDGFVALTGGWIADIAPFLTEGTRAEGTGAFRHTNQSLSAAIARYLVEIEAGGGRESLTVNVASLNLESARWLTRGLCVGILIILAWICRRPQTGEARFVEGAWERDWSRFGLECALVMIAMLFLSPISWINHYIVLLFPYAATIGWLETRSPGAPGLRFPRVALWLSFGLLLTSASMFLQALSLPLLGAVLLAAGVTEALRHAERDPLLAALQRPT